MTYIISDLETNYQQPFVILPAYSTFYYEAIASTGRKYKERCSFSADSVICLTDGHFTVFAVSISETATVTSAYTYEKSDGTWQEWSEGTSQLGNRTQITINGKSCYAYESGRLANIREPSANIRYYDIKPDDNTLWSIVYGTKISGDIKEIPVQWMRSDGEILEDTFTIEIGESEEGEEQEDPWAGSSDVSWGGHHYNINRRIVPEVHYANGYCWQEGTSEYTVEQAASMGWLILIR